MERMSRGIVGAKGACPHCGLTKEMAQKWASSLRNADGSTGPHWSIDQIKRVMAQMNIGGDPRRFWIAMNEVYGSLGSTLATV